MGIYVDVKTTHVSQALTPAAMLESLARAATTVLQGTRGFGGGRWSGWLVGDPKAGSPTGKMQEANHRTN